MTQRTLHLSGGILFLALAYFLAGVTLSHSGLQSHILPLWIPSGIALAVGISFGYRFLPGAWLGSFFFNLLYPANWELTNISPGLVATAAMIASGVLLQAWLGSWLVHNKIGNPLTTRGEGRVIRYILYVGFAVSLISASIALVALYLFSPPQYTLGTGLLNDWLRRWLGDAFGVLLVTPLLLAMLTSRLERTTSALYQRVITLFAGTLLAVLLANQAYMMQINSQLERNFQRDVDVFHANLNLLHQQNLADLGKLESQFVQNLGMSPGEFQEATAEIFTDNTSIRAYSWDPVIQPEQRRDFETTTRQLLNYPDYAIYGESPKPDDPLIPVQYVEPFSKNTAALGFNLLSAEDRRRWVIQAQQTGRPVATEILNLTQAPDEPGLLILQPVYLNQKTANSELLSTEKRLAGFMVGVFTVSRMIETALELSNLQGVQISITDASDGQPFYLSGDHQEITTPLHQQSFTFIFAQQEWQFHAAAGLAYQSLSPGVNTLQFQGLLVLISALISGVILGMHNRETTLAHRVKEQTRNLTFQAEHDPLTGLPNRLKLEQDLDQYFRGHSRIALMFIGLDRFKMINDSLGHLTGDSLLIELSARWMQEFQEQAELYRMGGDEFILVQTLTSEQDVSNSLALAQHLLDVTAQPLQAAGMHLQITASLGVAFSKELGEDANSLIRNADTALHQAKLKGKNRYQVYQSSQTTLTRKNFELEQDLRLAINTPQVVLHYQPQHRLSDMQLCGLEALVRWEHPVHGRIPPDQFIPLAEETQLIVPLGWQIIDLACRQIAEWQNAGFQVPCVAINISPQQLLQSDFIDQLNIIVDAYDLSRKQLELEITETLLHQDPDFAFKQLKSLRLAGYRLALDDFGTGYSSFNRLKYMPLDRLKIDRSFVRDIGKNPKDEAIILAIISLGKSLDIEVLAEGLETQEQQRFLVEKGCNSVQGYLHGRPQPSQDLALPA